MPRAQTDYDEATDYKDALPPASIREGVRGTRTRGGHTRLRSGVVLPEVLLRCRTARSHRQCRSRPRRTRSSRASRRTCRRVRSRSADGVSARRTDSTSSSQVSLSWEVQRATSSNRTASGVRIVCIQRRTTPETRRSTARCRECT